MGIPRLLTTLEPYAAQGSLDDASIVVDGPALAYHILNICRRNGFNQPSYDVLGQTAVAWLDVVGSGPTTMLVNSQHVVYDLGESQR
jgi:3-dehydroquinate dehydratase